MKRIFKYELIVADHSKLCLPIGARILSVQVQRGTVCLWAIVDEYQKELCFVDITERGNTYQMQIWLEKDLPERFNLEIWFVTYFSNMTKTSNI